SPKEIIHKIAEDLDANIVITDKVNEKNSVTMHSAREYREFVSRVKEKISNNPRLTPLNPDKGSEPSQETEGCADGIYSGSGLSSGFATLNFDVTVSGGCISGISGYFTGFTLGVSYSQGGTSFGCSSGMVCGTVNYNIFFEGIGTVYSELTIPLF